MSIFHDNGPSSELLRTFCAVADTGNVTRAGSVLARTQSAVSLQIKKLEDHLSVTLFERQARGVVLTRAGKKLLPAAKKALAEIEHIGEIFSTPLTGQIRVGIPDDYNDTILESALAQFSQKHSHVEVSVLSGCTAGFPEAIQKNKLDIAVYSAGPVAEKDAFFSEPTVWAASTEFILQEGKPLPLAIFDRDCWWRNIGTEALDKMGKDWKTVYLSENYGSVKAAIRAGLAIGILAKSAVEPSMQILGKKQGFPPLPNSTLQLLKNKSESSDIIQAMENAIYQAIN